MIVIGTILGSILGGIQSQLFGRKITILTFRCQFRYYQKSNPGIRKALNHSQKRRMKSIIFVRLFILTGHVFISGDSDDDLYVDKYVPYLEQMEINETGKAILPPWTQWSDDQNFTNRSVLKNLNYDRRCTEAERENG